jgi:tetratricopeptide (TPR) repeat protein
MNRAALRAVARLGLLLASCWTATPAHADADASTEAQALFERGVQLSQAEQWSEARDAFVRSAALTPRASTYYNLAVAALELGLARAALDAFKQFDLYADARTQADFIQQATDLRARVRARVGTLVLSLEPEDARVEVDGQLEPGTGERVVLLDPGMHTVNASAPGREATSFEAQIEAQSTLRRSVELKLAAEAPPAPAVDLQLRPDPASSAALRNDSATTDPAHDRASDHGRSLWAQPLTWVVIGAVVVGAVVTGVVIATHDSSKPVDPYKDITL